MLKEADIIQSLRHAFPIAGGIGDDAAVLPLNDCENYVISKDILVEHRHFRLTTTDAASLAHKALHVNLSDIAAMGAMPQFILMGIAIPPHINTVWIDGFMAAFAAACRAQNVTLIGGDTTASERDLFISITVIGRVAKTHLKFRSGAKPGDVICVVGVLGEAHAGFLALEKNAAGLDAVKARSLAPHALVKEGLWLGAEPSVTAMMDVSDGLYVDLSRLLQASHAGGIVDIESLQPSPLLAEAAAQLNIDARECMLVGGEDYALLFTVAPDAYDDLSRRFDKQFGYALGKIGTVTTTGDLQLREGGNPVPFVHRPFSHFGEL